MEPMVPLTIAVLTVSDTRTEETDRSGQAISVLLDKRIEGFGERFRQLSGEEIGSSTIQSRCLGGLANATVVFCLPGSTGACRTGWDGILAEQLDSRHKPCNFANLVIPGRGQHG